MIFSDCKQLTAIADQSKASDYKLALLIENLVLSDLFQKR